MIAWIALVVALVAFVFAWAGWYQRARHVNEHHWRQGNGR